MNHIALPTALPWIAVKDRLPDEGQRVIYYFEFTGLHVGKYSRSEYGNCFYGSQGWLTDDVTHWMPALTPEGKQL